MSHAPTYRAPPWLPGAHLQTIWPLARKGGTPAYRRVRWDTPDGDFIDLDWVDGPANAPLVVLFHGLEGSSRSHYARSLMRAVAERGWRGVVPHFRGCSGEPNRLARAYHSGDTEEIGWLLRRLRAIACRAPLFAAGVSLGGNALLKWLGERESGFEPLVERAVSVCAPLDLTVSGHALARGFNRIYTQHFLDTLKRKALAKCTQYPHMFDARRIREARTLFEFDDAYTAPAHDFADAADYWRRASSKPWLRAIHRPTLLLQAANDPFVPPAALPRRAELSPDVRFECPADGGHVGFLGGSWPGNQDWLTQRILHHFEPRA